MVARSMPGHFQPAGKSCSCIGYAHVGAATITLHLHRIAHDLKGSRHAGEGCTFASLAGEGKYGFPAFVPRKAVIDDGWFLHIQCGIWLFVGRVSGNKACSLAWPDNPSRPDCRYATVTSVNRQEGVEADSILIEADIIQWR